jgi:signal transduction histidine kinase
MTSAPTIAHSGYALAAQALEELPDGAVVLAASGVIEGINQAFLDMTGQNGDTIVGSRLESFVAEEDMLYLVGFEAMFGTTRVEDACVIFVAPDGARRPLSVCSRRSSDGRRVFITARPPGSLQRELADHSRWAANEQARADTLAAARDALAEKNEALRVAQEEVSRAYEALQDEVKTRERLEHELRLAQKLEAIGQLAAGVAHEINTPMQYVGDNIEFLGRALVGFASYFAAVSDAVAAEGSETLRLAIAAAQKKVRGEYLLREGPKALTAAKEGIERVGSIVRAMKSFAHVDEDDATPADLNRAIEDTLVVSHSEYRNIAVVETALAELPLVRCWVGRLSQVFLNLIVNAAHAIADAGRAGKGVIRVTSEVDGPSVVITFADNGCGIPDEIRRRVYDQFFTTKQVGRGTGQGLSLARRIIVDAHGGSLSFDSAVGVGTTFTLRLPIAGRAANGA